MTAWGLPHTLHYASMSHSASQRRGTLPYRTPLTAPYPASGTSWMRGFFGRPSAAAALTRINGQDGRECPKMRAVEDDCLKNTGSRRYRSRQYKEEVEGRILSFSLFYACMHFVCSLYASPTAYIFSPSALRTRLFAFLYALYAVNSGVVSSHSMHSRFFDAYNAYNLF